MTDLKNWPQVLKMSNEGEEAATAATEEPQEQPPGKEHKIKTD
jgi:hypothetical protein